MKTYHKIQTVFLRDPETKMKTLLEGQWSCPEFEYLQNCVWQATEKIHGTNIRVQVMPDGSLHFKGKTDKADLPRPLHKWLREHFGPRREQLAKQFPDGACLYGEGFGAGIQKTGELYSPNQTLILFDVRVEDWWLERRDVVSIAADYELPVVRVVKKGTLWELINMVARDQIPNSAWGDFAPEGWVATPMEQLFNRKGQRIITKLKRKDFRLTGGV